MRDVSTSLDMTKKCLLPAGIAVYLLISSALAQRPPPNISQDRDLKELDLTTWDCRAKLEGSARTTDGQERNRLKNRSASDISTVKLTDLDFAGFIKNVSQFDAATVHTRRKDLNDVQRQQLDPMEKDIVQVTGYLGVAYCGPPETTNCASVDFHDWHLELFEKPPERPPQPGDPTPIICEVTPRTQNGIFKDNVRIQELTAFFRTFDLNYESTGHPARKIRVTGYRLWDDEHNGAADVGTTVKRISPNRYHNPWRQTAWEIHPIIKIEPLASPMPPNSKPIQTPWPSSASATPKSEITTTPPEVSLPSPTVTEAATSPAAMPSPSPSPALTVQRLAPPDFVVITKPATIQIPYGQTTLQPGTKLRIVSRDEKTVTVLYMGEKYPIPLSSTDLQ